ncbi:polysaccharide biosynthesis tyrosine autokinase [Halomonas icarae]|uniref:Polysaccharide biosynthesis tyrosine autokinase n=1 Tax=Halomonas icarae TaxID=2691040 RepID=A0A7X4VWF7_9GAMM|nr:polysaccharide biosynthesis tyrosine autokinase [Halomonas icarae]MDR5903003.1 polysaccharide biosynthesis tyrosine autokinase [Halomonas icarae]NAW11560.1 polysaccharide biosynthesis tyrosine autokinase [Halomonas icarae]
MTNTQNSGTHPAPADDEIDLARLFGLLLDHKWLIFAITFLFAVGGVVYALLQTPVYRGDALVQVERRSTVSPLGDLSEVFGQEGESSTAAEVQILQSRMVLGQVVDRVGLDTVVRPNLLPVVGDFLVRRGIERPAFMAGKPWVWAGETLTLGRLEVADSLRGMPLIATAGEAGEYQLRLGGEMPRELGQGRVGELASFEGGDIQVRIADLQAPPGAEFTLVKRSRPGAINSLGTRLSVNELGAGGRGASTGMLRLTLTGPDRSEIRHSLDAVAETFLTQNVERQSAEAEQSLAFLEKQAPELRDKLSAAENRLNEYRVEQDSVDLSSEAQSVIQRFIELDSRLSELEFQEAELAERFTPSHPNYQALLRQKRQLQQQRAELEERVNELPAAQQEVVRRTRDVEVTQAIYVNVLNKMQELQIARAGTVGNVRIIDEALVGPYPIAPRKPLIVIIATLLGGMLGVGIVLLRGLLNRGVESPEQIESAGLPVYATVPLSDEQRKLVRRVKHRRDKHAREIVSGVLADRAPADTSIEALRSLRTSLHFAMLEASDNRLMISGPSPGIGKSFISINLGAVCAQAGQRVLIVDADMRKGHIHNAFKGRSQEGLSDLLSDRKGLLEVIRPSGIEGLDYVARGESPPNPSELLMTSRFTTFLEEVGQRYDLVIIDTPPVLAVTDAAVVGAQCGTTLMLARFQTNPIRELQIATRRLETAGVTVKGAILNAMERKAATSYGYGYYNYSYK